VQVIGGTEISYDSQISGGPFVGACYFSTGADVRIYQSEYYQRGRYEYGTFRDPTPDASLHTGNLQEVSVRSPRALI